MSVTNVIGSCTFLTRSLMSDKYAPGLTYIRIFSIELLNDSSDIFLVPQKENHICYEKCSWVIYSFNIHSWLVHNSLIKSRTWPSPDVFEQSTTYKVGKDAEIKTFATTSNLINPLKFLLKFFFDHLIQAIWLEFLMVEMQLMSHYPWSLWCIKEITFLPWWVCKWSRFCYVVLQIH